MIRPCAFCVAVSLRQHPDKAETRGKNALGFYEHDE